MHAQLLRSCLTFTTPQTVAYQAPLPWDFPGKNTRVSCHSLLQGILGGSLIYDFVVLLLPLEFSPYLSLLPCLQPSVFPFSRPFFRFGKFTAIMLSNTLSNIFCFSGTPVMQMFIYLIVSSINCCHFFIIIILLFFLLF